MIRRLIATLLVMAGIAGGQAMGFEAQGLSFAPSVRQYALQEITFRIDAAFDRPHDAAQVAVDGEFTAPSGAVQIVPAFFWRAADPVRNSPGPERAWKLRFTPTEKGPWRFRIRVARLGGGPEWIGEGEFQVTASYGGGFVRRHGRHFRLSDDAPFFPIGVNRCWGDPRDATRYLDEMDLLAASGVNTLRLWLAPWWLQIETEAGVFDPVAAARLDMILAHAEDLGMRVMLCIEQHGNFQFEGDEIGLWPSHPYNLRKGGPCRYPLEFFWRDEARRLFRNRLRYLVARWGYSTSLMAWELFNEVEWIAYGNLGYEHYEPMVRRWHVEMASFLRATDPFNRMVITSGELGLQRRLVQQGALDMVQVHLYEQEDLAGALSRALGPLAQEMDVPVMAGEFGTGKEGIAPAAMTRGMVAAAISGLGTSALPWLQEAAALKPYAERLSHMARFLGTVQWSEQRFTPLEATVSGMAADGVRVIGAAGREEILLLAWSEEVMPRTEHPLTLQFPAADGAYAVEVWDLATGNAVHRAAPATTAGTLRFTLPVFTGEAVIRIVVVR